jgi:AcrR family transcriptional regulator
MRLPAEQRRRQLLDVARDVFADSGFHATAMDDVAIEAGVTKPVLYQHFASKRALFVELLEHVGAQLLGEISSATDQATTPRERVESGFAAYFCYVSANPQSFRLLFGASVRNDPEFAMVAERTVDAIAHAISPMIEIAVHDEHRLVLANALVGMAEATSRRSLVRDDPADLLPAADLARWLAELAWFGLRGLRAE